jgi:hypothetical protein
LGYRVIYTFKCGEADRVCVEVAVEYTVLAAVAAPFTLRYQAGNDILHRLAGMLALENSRKPEEAVYNHTAAGARSPTGMTNDQTVTS